MVSMIALSGAELLDFAVLVDAPAPPFGRDDSGGSIPSLPDLLYVAWFALVGPVIDFLTFWPRFHRWSRIDPARAQRLLRAWTIGPAWALVTVGAVLWMTSGRSWRSFGLSLPEGWRLWTSIGLVMLVAAYELLVVATVARSAEAKASVRQQSEAFTAVLPRTRSALSWFGAVSLTAGFCEEFLFRGYFIRIFSTWLGWWGAAALSLLFFAGGHAYQGWSGILRTGIVGAIFTITVAIFDSLWPAIALHALHDLGGGVVAWLALRDEPAEPSSAVETAPGS